MPSLDGLKTWFDYELLFVGLVIALLITYWGLTRVTAFFGSLSLSSLQFTVVIAGICLSAMLVLFRVAGRLNRSS